MRPGVYVTESVLATPVAAEPPSSAAGAMVAILPSGPTIPTLVTSWYGFTRVFGNLNRDFEATFAANMFFRTGGRELFVSRVVKEDSVKASVTLLAQGSTEPWITFTAKAKGTYGNDLRVRISKNTADLYDIEILQEAGVDGDSIDDNILETFYNVDLATGGNAEVENIFSIRSQFVDAIWPAVDQRGDSIPTSIAILPLTGGTDGTANSAYDYDGALDYLKEIDRTFIIFSPGVTDSSVVSGMVAFAEETKSFAVLDTAPNLSAAAAVTYAGTVDRTSYAAVYYPHLWVPDSTSRSRDAIRKVSPSGAVAGLYLNTDAVTGVFKAPAGIQANLPGVIALEKALTAAELDALNNDTSPVNAIRVIPGVGAAVMGARTLDQRASTRYVNLRRTLLFLDREMRSRLEFALFRNNDSVLWSQMRTAVDVFLDGFWASGGLRGNNKDEAFYVKIDRENNTASDVANGIVNVEVGVALQYPAEFVKIKLTQQTQA